MGATLYRCITGVLPPDSIERIHGDTLKRPSELGISISSAIEQAILKALSIRTEDRFMSMEAFICALNGDVATASAQSPSPGSTGKRTAAMYRRVVFPTCHIFCCPVGTSETKSASGSRSWRRSGRGSRPRPLFAPFRKIRKKYQLHKLCFIHKSFFCICTPRFGYADASQTPPGQDSDAPDDPSSGDSNDSTGTEIVTYDLGIFKCYHRRSGRV